MQRLSLRETRLGPRFIAYAVACAVPVVLLGLVLAASFQRDTSRQGAAQRMALMASPARSSAMGGAPVSPRPSMTQVMAGLRATAATDGRVNRELMRAFERDLILGLGGLYLLLFVLTASVSRRLRRDAARSEALANNDGLTGLPNRTSFARAAGAALAEAQRSGVPAAIALIDLDRFKHVNDTLGHRNGDDVLRELALRLSAVVDDETIVARLGGDEFGIVLADGGSAVDTLRRIREAFECEVPVAGLSLHIPASIGYVLAPDDGGDIDTLLQRADVAMYTAKDGRLGVVRYESRHDRYDAATLGLVAELRHAIDDDQLVLHYQPQLHLGSDRVIALEALVRWQHPVHGLLFPDRFLPLAEQTDDIERLTAWVLRRALRDIEELGGRHGAPRVAVNVSARSLGRGELADEVLSALAELGIEPDRLIIEVTETAIFIDPERAAGELDRLAQAGVKVSLDDFGSGQTSIGHFSALPLHELKIDRSFVGDMDCDPTHAAIVRSLVELGRNLGLQVVAEGVENDVVRGLLSDAGTDVLQGYLLSKPLPLDQVVRWLAERPACGAATRPSAAVSDAIASASLTA